MTIRTVVQSSFSGGQVDKSVLGRADIDGYKNAALEMQNFMPTKTGSMRRRPGTIHCCNLFDSYVRDSEETADGLSYRDCNFFDDNKIVALNDSTERQSVLALSPSVVNLLELGRPRSFDVGSAAFCPRIISNIPEFPNAQYDWNECGSLSADADVGVLDNETRTGETDIYDRPNPAFTKTMQVEDVMYIAPGGLTPLHAATRARLYGSRTFTPSSADFDTAVANNDQGLVNLPVGFLDGPYIDSSDMGDGILPGRLLTNNWPTYVQTAIDLRKPFFPIADRNGNVPPGINATGSTPQGEQRTHPLGETVLHLMSRTQANYFRRRFGMKPIPAQPNNEERAVDFVEGDPTSLSDILNDKMAAETPMAIELPIGTVSCRFAFSFMGAFACGMSDGTDFYPGAPEEDADKNDTTKLTVLVLRVNQTLPQKRETYLGTNGSQEKNWPYGPDGTFNSPETDYSEYGRVLNGASFRVGPDVMAGIGAMCQSQGRMFVSFKSIPGRVFATTSNGFSIRLSNKDFEVDRLRFHSNSVLNDRLFLEFQDSTLTDVLSISATDSFQLSTVGDSGARIRHMVPYKTNILLATASSMLAVSPARGEVLTPTNAKVINVSSNGISRTTPPLIVDDKIYFVDSSDSRLTELKLSNESGTDSMTREVSVASSSIITDNQPVQGGMPSLTTQRRIRSMSLHQYPIQHIKIVKSNGSVGNFVCESQPDIKSFTTTQMSGFSIKSYAYVNDANGSVTFASASNANGQFLIRETKEKQDGYNEGLVKLDAFTTISITPPLTPPGDEDTISTPDGDVDGGGGEPEPPQLVYENVNAYALKEFSEFFQCLLSGGSTTYQEQFAKSPYKSQCDQGTVALQFSDGSPLPASQFPSGTTFKLERAGETFDDMTADGDDAPERPYPLFSNQTVDSSSRQFSFIGWFAETPSPPQGDTFLTVNVSAVASEFDVIRQWYDDGTAVGSAHIPHATNLRLTIIPSNPLISDLTTGQVKNAQVPQFANEGVVVIYDGRVYGTQVDASGNVDFASIGITDFPEGAIVGQRFDSKYESMPVAVMTGDKGQGSDVRSNMKRIYKAHLHINDTYGGRAGCNILDDIQYDDGLAVALPTARQTGVIEHSITDDADLLTTFTITTRDTEQFELQALHLEVDKGGVS